MRPATCTQATNVLTMTLFSIFFAHLGLNNEKDLPVLPPCMCVHVCMCEVTLHLTVWKCLHKQMVAMYIKATHAVGACATIKLA